MYIYIKGALPLDPRTRNNHGLRNSVENQPRLANSLKSLLREQSFLQNRGFATETN